MSEAGECGVWADSGAFHVLGIGGNSPDDGLEVTVAAAALYRRGQQFPLIPAAPTTISSLAKQASGVGPRDHPVPLCSGRQGWEARRPDDQRKE